MALREQRNAQIQAGIAVVVVIVAWQLEVKIVDWCLLALCMGLVLATEVMNTAVETVVDLITEEHHKLAGKAKDIAAGASLVAAMTAAVVGGMVLLPPLLNWALSLNS